CSYPVNWQTGCAKRAVLSLTPSVRMETDISPRGASHSWRRPHLAYDRRKGAGKCVASGARPAAESRAAHASGSRLPMPCRGSNYCRLAKLGYRWLGLEYRWVGVEYRGPQL